MPFAILQRHLWLEAWCEGARGLNVGVFGGLCGVPEDPWEVFRSPCLVLDSSKALGGLWDPLGVFGGPLEGSGVGHESCLGVLTIESHILNYQTSSVS